MKSEVYALIRKHPGLHKSDILKILKISTYKLDAHIRDLIKENKIKRYYQKMNDIRYEEV